MSPSPTRTTTIPATTTSGQPTTTTSPCSSLQPQQQATATTTTTTTPTTTTVSATTSINVGTFQTPALPMHPPSPPPPPLTLQTHTPPSNSDDLDPSPAYSPLSTPAQTPRPPPSPPMAPVDAPPALPRPHHVDIAGAGATPTRATAQATTPVTTPPTAPSTSPSASAATSTDSIALRSTLRLLMLQRERARNDIQTLEELRLQALDKPVEFIEYIQELAAAGRPTSSSSSSDEESTTKSTKATSSTTPTTSATPATKKRGGKRAAFAATKDLPKPQEIYRCPTIEWQKYHVLGAPLDKLVEEQQRRPMVVPQQMQTGGILGVGAEFGEKISGDGGVMKGRMRLFDGVSQRGGVVGR